MKADLCGTCLYEKVSISLLPCCRCVQDSNMRDWVPKMVDQEEVLQSPANARQVAGTHYKEMGIEPWDVIDTWPLDQRIGAYRAGALKYVMRMGSKDEDLQEIEKGRHYLDKLIEVLDARDAEDA